MTNIKPVYNSTDEDDERKSFLSVLAAFKCYRSFSLQRVNKSESCLNSLQPSHQEMLKEYRQHLQKIRYCIDENNQVLRKLTKGVENLFVNPNETVRCTQNGKDGDGHTVRIRQQELDSPVERFKLLKVQITLKQLARDWSSDGEEERNQCYKPIIQEIENFFGGNDVNQSEIKILVPGAGLGRLAYELAYRGYFCEGNEFSFFMLLASNFVLNKCLVQNQFTIYPWVHQFCNNTKRSDQVRSVQFPDVSPCQAPPKGTLNMVAGDFLQVYTIEDSWDCVATCFFIDCANNVADFIENIYRILKPGGIWINLGPLLYHYSDMPNENSIEPTYEDLLIIIKAIGFEILKNEIGVRTQYSQNPRSMQQSEYLSIYFLCKKPLNTDEDIPISGNEQD